MSFDVFISYKHSDENGKRTTDSFMAEELYNELKKKGINAFFSHISIAEKGEHRFNKMINTALDESIIFVLVCTDLHHLKSTYVTYEIECFNEEMLNGNKSQEKSAMYSYLTTNVATNKLPMELRHCQAFFKLADIVSVVCKRLENSKMPEVKADKNRTTEIFYDNYPANDKLNFNTDSKDKKRMEKVQAFADLLKAYQKKLADDEQKHIRDFVRQLTTKK